MIKRNITFLLFFILLFFAITSCEKLEIPTTSDTPSTETSSNTNAGTDNENNDHEEQEDTDEQQPNMNDPTNVIQYMETHGFSEDCPFSVSDFKTYIPIYLSYYGASGIKDSYVHGYIVGCIKGKSISQTIFSATDVETNIVIATSPTETDYNQCIAIQLTTNSNNSKTTRQALNLSDNPQNIGKSIIIYGNIDKYMGDLGIKNARKYWWNEQ